MSVHKGKKLEQISFPLGGIGTGSIGLAGNGRLIDWEIFNRPNKGSDNSYTHIAVKATKGEEIKDARVLSGDVTTNLSGQYGSGFGYGLSNRTMAGFPISAVFPSKVSILLPRLNLKTKISPAELPLPPSIRLSR